MDINLQLKTKYNVGDKVVIVNGGHIHYTFISFVSIYFNGREDYMPEVRYSTRVGIETYTEPELDRMQDENMSLRAKYLSYHSAWISVSELREKHGITDEGCTASREEVGVLSGKRVWTEED